MRASFLVLALLSVAAYSYSQKELSKSEKEAEKERLKRPAQVTINAPMKKVRSLLITERVKMGWRLDGETESSVTLSRRSTFQVQLSARMGGGATEARSVDVYVLADTDDGTLVVADLTVTYQGRRGNNARMDYNRNKDFRRETEAFLGNVKKLAESAASKEKS